MSEPAQNGNGTNGSPHGPAAPPRLGYDGEQGLLIDASDDRALLLPPEEMRKVYTAGQVEKLERLLKCILKMLAWGMPHDDIAEASEISKHTLQVLAQRYAGAIGENALRLADYAQQLSARCAYQASQQLHKATGKDAAIMHGIFRDTAINLRAAGGAGEEETAAIDVTSVSERRAKFLEAVKALGSGEQRSEAA